MGKTIPLLLGVALGLQTCHAQPAGPVARAAASDAVELRRLIAAGADVEERGADGWTPLVWAAHAGRVDSIQVLLASGAAVDGRDHAASRWTPLVHAIHKGHNAAARALLQAGADPNAQQADGATPLMFAAAYGNADVVRELLDCGADPRAETAWGGSALVNAVGGGALFDFTDGPALGACQPDVVRVLLARAPDLTLKRGPWVALARGLGDARGCPEAFALLEARHRS
jgi:hypothetical protein